MATVDGSLRKVWPISAGASLLLVVLVLGGCGSGGGEGTNTATKPGFLKGATAICKHAQQEKEQAISKALAKGEPSKQDLEKVVQQSLVPTYRKALAGLRRLEAPADEQQTVESMLGSYEAAIEDTEREPGELVEGDPFGKAEKAARQYGLPACVF